MAGRRFPAGADRLRVPALRYALALPCERHILKDHLLRPDYRPCERDVAGIARTTRR